jgi:hypothetical protein
VGQQEFSAEVAIEAGDALGRLADLERAIAAAGVLPADESNLLVVAVPQVVGVDSVLYRLRIHHVWPDLVVQRIAAPER